MTRDLPARASQWQAGLITPHAGLALLGEFAVGLGLLDSIGKNPGPKDPALVIPRGDFVSWNLNGLWSIGVMECWKNFLITD
jgi:hypothetical protein